MAHRTYNWMQFLDNHRTPCSSPHESCRPHRDFLVHRQKMLDCIPCDTIHVRSGFVLDGILTPFYSLAYYVGIEIQQYQSLNRVLNRHKVFIISQKCFSCVFLFCKIFALILFWTRYTNTYFYCSTFTPLCTHYGKRHALYIDRHMTHIKVKTGNNIFNTLERVLSVSIWWYVTENHTAHWWSYDVTIKMSRLSRVSLYYYLELAYTTTFQMKII